MRYSVENTHRIKIKACRLRIVNKRTLYRVKREILLRYSYLILYIYIY